MRTHRTFPKFIRQCIWVMSLFLVADLHIVAIPAFAGAFGTSSNTQQGPYTPLQHATPVVQEGNGDIIGVFGGTTDVATGSDRFQTAFLAVSTSGYLLPVLPAGEVVALAPLYFQSEDCSGMPYVEPSAPEKSYPPHPGLVFRSATDDVLVYISRYAVPAIVEARSVWQLQEDGNLRCNKQDKQAELLQAISNNELTTGVASRCCSGPVSIKVLTSRERPKQSISADTKNSQGYIPESDEALDPEEKIYECSPGCMAGNVGDGLCDITCYSDACRFDDGDCDTLGEEELRKELDTLCSPGCFLDDVGDGFCDAFCNVPACSYDDGDCESHLE